MIGAIRHAVGDYGVLLPDKLLAGRGDEHETIWMPLRGARFAYMEELPEDHVLPVARIKKLADTPEMSGRLIGKDHVTWAATHTIVISTNYLPVVKETDHGTWRRLAMVNYPFTFTGDAKDATLKKRLKNAAHPRPYSPGLSTVPDAGTKTDATSQNYRTPCGTQPTSGVRMATISPRSSPITSPSPATATTGSPHRSC